MRRLLVPQLTVAFLAVGAVTILLHHLLGVTNAATVALTYLLVVLFVAAWAPLGVAFATSIVSVLAVNFFFLPPVHTLTISDPHNLVALAAFLVVSVVASHLSSTARARAREALERRNELARLFDVTRDILLTTEEAGAIAAIARHVARRFELETVAVCRPGHEGGWEVVEGGPVARAVGRDDLDLAFAAAQSTLEFDARTRTYSGHREIRADNVALMLVPIRLGTRPIGLLALGGRTIEAGTADAIAGVVAIAIERAHFLGERHVAELAHQRAELSSALLASLSHDLRTPLTAARVALSNMQDPALDDSQRVAQAQLARDALAQLSRLFDEILDMARIETKTLQADPQWITPVDVVDAAVAHVGRGLEGRDLRLEVDQTAAVHVDPRLTSAALAHLLENAAQYSPPGSTVHVTATVNQDGLRIEVTDEGPGLEPEDLERLFEPFFRGRAARNRAPGTGMGLAITRGFLAVESGRVWAENVSPHGARFTLSVPTPRRPVSTRDEPG
jgi:two-component system sensor histidine kinase KdpD